MMHDGNGARWTRAKKGFQAMAAMQQEEAVDWQTEAIDLKRQGLESKDIAEAVGKSAATVRKAIAKARERGDLQYEDETKAEADLVESIEGQTTVDDFMGHSHDRDPLEDFRQEAGEAVGEMQPRPGEEPAGELDPEVPGLPVMPGTRQLALDLGPNAAPVGEATVMFKSEKWPSGFFGMGDIVTGTFTARIVGVPAKEKFDEASGEYRAQPVAYAALITEIEYEAVEPD